MTRIRVSNSASSRIFSPHDVHNVIACGASSLWENVCTKCCCPANTANSALLQGRSSLSFAKRCRLLAALTSAVPSATPSSSFSSHPLSFFSLLFLFNQRYGQLYDLSRSESSKVRELAVTMATDGQPLDRIGELLRVAVGPLDLSVKTVLQDAVEEVVAALRLEGFLLALSACDKSGWT